MATKSKKQTKKTNFDKNQVMQYLSDAKHHLEIHKDSETALNILKWIVSNDPECSEAVELIKSIEN